jgi:hypothetical protein
MKLSRIILILIVSLCLEQCYSQIVVPQWMSRISKPNKCYLKTLINKKSTSLNKALGIHVEKNSFVCDTVSSFMSLFMELNMDTDTASCAVQGTIIYNDSCGSVSADVVLRFTVKRKVKDDIQLMNGTLKNDYDLVSIEVDMPRCKNGTQRDDSDVKTRWMGADNKLIENH